MSGNRLCQQRGWEALLTSQLQLAAHLCNMGLLHVKSHWTLSPSLLTYYSPPSPPLQPCTPLSGCWSPGEEEGRVKGSKSFPLWISGLAGRGLPENGCIRAGVGGQDFNSVKEQLVWVSPHFSLPSLSPQIQGDEKFVQRGTSKIKRFTVQSLTLTLL